MLRRCTPALSTALRNPTPFRDGALQLAKLHLAHLNASADGNARACRLIESEFAREVEAFRPCFTMGAPLEAAQDYTRRVHRALRYFAFHDDPLMRQVELLLGRQDMRQAQRRAADADAARDPRAPPQARGKSGNGRRAQGLFRGARVRSSSSSASRGSSPGAQEEAVPTTAECADARTLEAMPTVLPAELPNPPRIDARERLRDGAVRLPHRHRGHWVLQEPEIAITRAERREDPW